ncbi:hypothetical protein [Paludibaculum fermentans]|uniref:IPT/TIG domain-containing protein n=1 Tax=Paludibaculum fermentans TaxID=1473598 RepID=A0A7S7SLL2_PALFE|nr:hypothetical protein [Paludibaculum fermentans]QOY88150.1 hypothetical protein IRI77_36350 [Paludibaculum fermentans]
MTQTTKFMLTALSAVSLMNWPAAGQQKRNPAPAVGSEVRVLDETQPAGGTVQLKLSLTEPKPISSGTKRMALDPFAFDAVFGISLWSPLGDVFGVAHVDGGQLAVNSMSPLSSLGTVVDYPILTVAAHIRPDAAAGMTVPLSLDPGSTFVDALGFVEPFVPSKPGILTLAGSASIHNVVPGGGTWPAGTVIHVAGSGFDPAARVRTKFKTKSVLVVNPSEIQLVLAETVEMDAQKINVTNPNKDTVDYFSYLRAVPQGASVQPVVASAHPIFPRSFQFLQVSTTQQSQGVRGTQLTALAIQNSNAATAQIRLEAWTPAGGVLASASLALAYGESITRELGEYFHSKLSPGTMVRVFATVPVQVVSFTADTSTGDLKPFISTPF